jgi:hypothetical protein
MLNHQQIPEGHAFVEPRDVETARGLIAAAESIGVDPAVVRTQASGYLAPIEVVEAWEGGDDTVVTTADDVASETGGDETPDGPPAKSASKGDWVEYAVGQGYDESEDLSKSQLIERFGATE